MLPTEPAPFSALIVDDESLGRDVVRYMLGKHPNIEILGERANAEEAITAIKELLPQIIFLDIKMPGVSGVELVRKLPSAYAPFVVFITAYDQFAIDAFEEDAVDYLLKPFDQARFDRMIERVLDRIQQKGDATFGRQIQSYVGANKQVEPIPGKTEYIERFPIKENGRVFFIKPQQIEYLEASGNYVALRVEGKSHLVYDTLSSIEQKLDTKNFLRIHRSTIVNIDQIKELQTHFNGEYIVILKSGSRLKLSRSFRTKAKAALGLE